MFNKQEYAKVKNQSAFFIACVTETMPTTLFYGPYRFSFFSLDCKEPRHTHVWRENNEAKFWLDPIQLTYNNGFSRKDLRAIERIIEEHIELLRERWDEHCRGRLN